MIGRSFFRLIFFLGLLGLSVSAALYLSRISGGFFYQLLFELENVKEHSEQLRQAILSYGIWAPVIFTAIQIMQVVVAPIPGEASGFLGGYLFGVWPSFLYSTIGLTIGSGVAFAVGRLLGEAAPKAFRNSKTFLRFNHLVCRGDFVVPFLLFIIPGFPKDSLSYLLGVSRMPFPVFLFITAIGRMPGTFMLSLQGTEVYQGDFLRLLLNMLFSLAIIFPCYLYRKQLHDWLGRFNNHNGALDGFQSCDSSTIEKEK